MSRGYKTIFWGIVFISFHINLGSFQILPNFIGWAMVVSGINQLRTIYNSARFEKASVIALIAVFHSIISLLVTFRYPYADNSSPFMMFWIILISILEILIEYFIIHGSAEYLYDGDDMETADNLVKLFQWYLIIYFLNTILVCISFTLYNNSLTASAAVIGMVLRVWFLALISRLKKHQQEEEMTENQEQ
ncbi:hypothetical protein Ana3638_04785 [Anaerocolumna sedimenticola]|uniref:Uncharacterized protein n=1 Tax=Anaerocolumna sedimenticola TaxID=2696063 RepID=A0A6P1TJ88_9FIRM|nr:hypothetical protein [Anaerocolumna sedimenticola]QHQ60179.1 hypothetical protein Ana3638_04785 [Anaerocolumna sedimenticola]